MSCNCLLLLLMALVGVLLTGPELAADGFACAGHAVYEPSPGAAAKTTYARFLPAQGRVHALVIYACFQDEVPGERTAPTAVASSLQVRT